jgi:hypothetical protein
VVLGGGNVKKLKELPPGTRLGDNANAFLGGFRLWNDAGKRTPLKGSRYATRNGRSWKDGVKHGAAASKRRP